jgi:hypothetical protein
MAKTHRIDLRPDLRPEGHGRTPMLYNGKLIGKSNSPIYDAARWLLENHAAWLDDTVETWRGETLCMSGVAGELAKWTVEERKDGKPSLELRRWKPFPARAVLPPAAKTPSRVTMAWADDCWLPGQAR